MRILFVQDSLGTGGAERSNAELWYFLQDRGIEFKVVVLEHRKEGIEKEIIGENLNVEFIKEGNFLSETIQIRKIIAEYNPDIIHSVLLRSNLRTRFAQVGLSKVHIESLVNCTYAEIRYSDPKINSSLLKIYETLDKITGKFGVNRFIPITHTVKEHYIEKLNIKPDKMIVIPRGRKINKFYLQASSGMKYNSDSITFIHVGRQEFQKGHLVLLNAIKLIDDELHKRKVQFLFCGRKGNASDQINNFLKTNNLKTRIKFLGHRNDIPELLAKADIFIFPSLYEGLGGSMIEAQAAGLPIVCSDIPVFKEVVTSQNALFHKSNDSQSLANRILEIFERDLDAMGMASYNNYNENFVLENINSKMLSTYEHIMESRK